MTAKSKAEEFLTNYKIRTILNCMKSSAKACLTTQEIQKRLVDAGVQATVQRISICRYVLCEAEHPTAEDVHSWAEKNLATISLATVYNTLGTLVKAGILREFRFPHTEKVIYDNNIEDHYHFLDEATQKLHDVCLDDIKISVDIAKRYKIKQMDILLKGNIQK